MTRPAKPVTLDAPAPPERSKVWAVVHHEDSAAFVARLRAAGFPPGVIRGLVTARVNRRYDSQIRDLRDPDAATPFWKLKDGFYGEAHQRMEQTRELMQERARVARDLFADGFFANDEVSADQRRQFGRLSRSKIDILQRIEDDYSQMNSAVRAATGGINLPEDRAKLELLAREKLADLAAALTPEELADYRRRTSPITALLRDRSGGFEASEAEFHALFRVQENLNARISPGNFSLMDQGTRRVIHDQYLVELHTALGPARFADYVRESSDEFQQIVRLVERSNLPRELPVQVYDLRESIAIRSNQIFDDRTLDVQAKRDALQRLAQAGRQQILQVLGGIAGPSYLKITERWLPYLERGAAVSFARAQTLTFVTDSNRHSFGASPDFRFLPTPRP